jgi:hypothetical protein
MLIKELLSADNVLKFIDKPMRLEKYKSYEEKGSMTRE